jgi:predicted nucleotidyltransferase
MDACSWTPISHVGSVARGEDRPDSDVDLLVELPATFGLFGVDGFGLCWRHIPCALRRVSTASRVAGVDRPRIIE